MEISWEMDDLWLTQSQTFKVPIAILPEKRHITWVLPVLFFMAEFQIETPGLGCKPFREKILHMDP